MHTEQTFLVTSSILQNVTFNMDTFCSGQAMLGKNNTRYKLKNV